MASVEEAHGAIAFTLGRWTTPAEIDAILERLPPAVARLRAGRGAPRRAP